MLVLRNYLSEDGDVVASWVTDLWTLRVWSADCYPGWPVAGKQITALYRGFAEQDPSFRALVAEENGVQVGQLILRYLDQAHTTVHFGFVIVDPAQRGKGLGKRLLLQAMELAYGEMGAEKVELMVFTCNEKAHQCYRNLGFADVRKAPIELDGEIWDRWQMERTK